MGLRPGERASPASSRSGASAPELQPDLDLVLDKIVWASVLVKSVCS